MYEKDMWLKEWVTRFARVGGIDVFHQDIPGFNSGVSETSDPQALRAFLGDKLFEGFRICPVIIPLNGMAMVTGAAGGEPTIGAIFKGWVIFMPYRIVSNTPYPSISYQAYVIRKGIVDDNGNTLQQEGIVWNGRAITVPINDPIPKFWLKSDFDWGGWANGGQDGVVCSFITWGNNFALKSMGNQRIFIPFQPVLYGGTLTYEEIAYRAISENKSHNT